MDTATGDTRSAELTASDKGGGAPHLLDQIPPDEEIGAATGGGEPHKFRSQISHQSHFEMLAADADKTEPVTQEAWRHIYDGPADDTATRIFNIRNRAEKDPTVAAPRSLAPVTTAPDKAVVHEQETQLFCEMAPNQLTEATQLVK